MKFELISNKFCCDIILLNIEYLQIETVDCKININTLEEQLIQAMKAADFKSCKDKMGDTWIHHCNTIEQMKQEKWFRDMEDYNAGKVFAWQMETTKKSSA